MITKKEKSEIVTIKKTIKIIEEEFGKKCIGYEKYCVACKAWKTIDGLLEILKVYEV